MNHNPISGALAVWLLVAWLPASAVAQSSDGMRVCRSGSVEMIVGGVGSAPSNCPLAPSLAPAPASAPKAAAANRVRLNEGESERRRILEQELQHEQSVLNALLKQGSNADSATLARTHSNLAALRQELARAAP